MVQVVRLNGGSEVNGWKHTAQVSSVDIPAVNELLLSAIKQTFLDIRGVNQREIVLNLPQMIHSKSPLGTAYLMESFYLNHGIVCAHHRCVMLQVCEDLTFHYSCHMFPIPK